jgi:hypothetical protein
MEVDVTVRYAKVRKEEVREERAMGDGFRGADLKPFLIK